MVKFSVGGYDDGEGPSNPTQKRRRVDEEEEDAEAEEHNPQQQHQSFEMDYPPIGTPEPQHSNHGNGGTVGSNGDNAGPSNDRGKNVAAIITDPDVLDCFICCEPLTIPVFQCENGHIACSSCCAKIRNKCPLCLMPIGYYRCRAIEKLLESIKISCPNAKYGCKVMFSYSVKSRHEKECRYIPCLCPHTDCDFVASSRELALHFSHRHVNSGIQFTYDKFFSVFLNTDQKTIVLRDEKDVRLFIVHNDPMSPGNAVNISCLGPKSLAGFHYDVLARSQGSTLILQSSTKIIQENTTGAPTTGFLLIPSDFFLFRTIQTGYSHKVMNLCWKIEGGCILVDCRMYVFPCLELSRSSNLFYACKVEFDCSQESLRSLSRELKNAFIVVWGLSFQNYPVNMKYAKNILLHINFVSVHN